MHLSLVLFLGAVWAVKSQDSTLKCPEMCVCSTDFDVFHCKNVFKIPDHKFSTLTKEIHLTRNFRGPLTNGTFANLNALEKINVTNSQVNFIQTGAFTGLTNLKTLLLSGNSIQLLDNVVSLFKDNVKLEVLDLSRNKLNFLPDEPFRYLPNLKVLNVSFNQLLSARLGPRFQVTTGLRVLDFSGNMIETVTGSDFAATQSWESSVAKSVNFSQCHLKYMEPEAVTAFKKLDFLGLAYNDEIAHENMSLFLDALHDVMLKKIDLSYTNLSYKINISDFTVDTLGRLSIQEMNLAGNNLENIDENVLSYLSLRKLNLNHNNLETIGAGISKLTQLTHFDMSHNAIASVSEDFKNTVVNMEHLNFAENKLDDASNLDLSKATKLLSLDLSNNLFEQFTIPPELTKLRDLKLKGNKISQLNNGEPLAGLTSLSQFDISYNKLTTLNAFMFRDSSKIQNVNFAENEINSISHQAFVPYCPKTLDLSGNRLESVSHCGWNGIEAIKLGRNIITSVDEQAFFFLHSLKTLDLHGNEISKLPIDVFSQSNNITRLDIHKNNLTDGYNLYEVLKPLHSLMYLDLSSNNFSVLNVIPEMFPYDLLEISLAYNHLQVIDPAMFRGLKRLTSIDMSRNPFHCACENIAMRDWLKSTSVTILNTENYGYICRTPVMRGGKTLLNYDTTVFECHKNLFYIVLFSSIGGGAMLIAAAVATIYCVVRCRRKGNVDIQSKSESVELISHERKKTTNDTREPISTEEYLKSVRDNYLKGHMSDTLVDVEFETPNMLIDPRIDEYTVSKARSSRRKPEKRKEKRQSISKKKNVTKRSSLDSKRKKYFTQMYEILHDSRPSNHKDYHKLKKDKENLKKILVEMDKEYKKILEKKKGEKKRNTDKNDKKVKKRSNSRSHSKPPPRSKSRGNRDLIRMISMRQSRSMPDVLSYVNSLPRLPPESRHREYRPRRMPIYHVDHYDPEERHGWVRSMVDIPRRHRSSTNLPYEPERRVARALSVNPHSVYNPGLRYAQLEADYYRDPRIPIGYHTVSAGKHALLVDSRYHDDQGTYSRLSPEIELYRERRPSTAVRRESKGEYRRPSYDMENRLHRDSERKQAMIPNGHVQQRDRKSSREVIDRTDETDVKLPVGELSSDCPPSSNPPNGYHTVTRVPGEKVNGVITETVKTDRLDGEKSAIAEDKLSQWV